MRSVYLPAHYYNLIEDYYRHGVLGFWGFGVLGLGFRV